MHWATLSFTGVKVFLVSVFGYALGGALVIFAMLKSDLPASHWVMQDRQSRTAHGDSIFRSLGTPPQGQELLGWWVPPVGLLLGTCLLLLTFRFGTWSIRKFWRPGAGQQSDGQTSLSSVGEI